jgi:hypothetical protein
MRAHLRKAAIEAALFTERHRIDRSAHIVIDAAGSLEESERSVMGAERHLLSLARYAHERHVSRRRRCASLQPH